MMTSLREVITIIVFGSFMGFAQAQEGPSAAAGSSESTPLEIPIEPSEESEDSEVDGIPTSKPLSPRGGNAGVEKIEVTGSHIKRIDVEGPSPVLTLDQEYLDKSGYNSVADVLRDLPVASFGGTRENALSGGASTGAGTTSLRGFGPDAILVLLDGRRLPGIGGSSSVDLNLIPKSAVERVEILKDGASAIYGSDALGGVINIITKKNFDGANIEIGYTLPELAGGQRTDVKASAGKTGSNYSVMGVVQYRSNNPVYSRDRDFTNLGPSDLGSYSQTGSPGSYRAIVTNAAGETKDKNWNAGGGQALCPEGRRLSTSDADGNPTGDMCGFDYSKFSQITPKIDQYSGLVGATLDLNESLKFFARGFFTQRDVSGQLAPSPDNFRDDTRTGRPNYLVPESVINQWGLPSQTLDPGETLQGYDIRYRIVEEAGPRLSEVTSQAYSVQTGLNGYVWDTWEWETSVNYGDSSTVNRGIQGYADKQILYEGALASGDFFNPFASAKSDISSALFQPEDKVQSSVATVDLSASGELGMFLAGPLMMAIGVSSNWQTFEQSSDPITAAGRQWGGGTSLVGKGQRDFQSVYTEFSALPFEGLETQFALRFDQFSDFGSTVNPKVALRYNPIKPLLLRASWGTGFKAPALEQLYSGTNIGFPFGQDPVTGFRGQFQTLTSGNRNLKQETSESFNVGMVLEPVERLEFSLDYWRTEQDSAISSGILRDIFNAEQIFGNDFLVSNYGVDVVRVGDNVDQIVLPYINVAKRDVEGMDFSLAYRLPLGGDWNFNIGSQHAILIKYLVEPFPGLGFENRVGFYGNPYWRNTAGFGASNPVYSAGLSFRTIGEQAYSFNDPNSGQKTRDHTEVDLRLGFNGSWGGSLSGGVRNLFGTDRPRQAEYRNAGFINGDLYDPVGTAYYLNYSQDF